MNTETYAKARSFCHKLDKRLYTDLLHDSYLHWFEKTNNDLFDEPLQKVIHVIKLTWRGYRKPLMAGPLSPVESPEDILIAKELDEYSNSLKLLIEIYMLAVQGATANEIRRILELPKSTKINLDYFN